MENNLNGTRPDPRETRTALEALNAGSASFDPSLNYAYGVLALYTNAFACIKPG